MLTVSNLRRSGRPEVPDPRLSQLAGAKSLLSLPPGMPLGFPPFLLPPSSLQEVIKDSPFQFLPGMARAPAPRSAPSLPPGMFPPGLLDPSHAQALLAMMRGQPHVQARPLVTPDTLASDESPAKRQKRDSASLDNDAPVSPPPSSLPPLQERPCRSECSVTQACSEEGRLMINWTVDQVVEHLRRMEDMETLLGQVKSPEPRGRGAVVRRLLCCLHRPRPLPPHQRLTVKLIQASALISFSNEVNSKHKGYINV